MRKLTVGLFNDSFPPTIDGVANVTLNYAKVINRDYGRAVVATPAYPDVEDSYAFDVIRYPSVYMGDEVGYRAGYPFDPAILRDLEHENIDIIHAHAPFISTVLARVLRSITGAPIVFTYHTKFDIDFEKVMASDMLRQASVKFILSNINACDDVWVVSEGAGENLRSLGYTGDYVVMENGTDFDKRRADPARVDKLRRAYCIPTGVPVFLFVGRMMWYKGVRISLDGLKQIKEQGEDFRFFLIGDGADRADIEEYVRDNDLEENCVFTGTISDREVLREYFTLADLFLFPSSFDTNGIVVREAAACSCPSIVLRGSAAAEGITDGETGIMIGENADSMAQALLRACHDRPLLEMIGQNAAARIHITWEQAVDKAYARYLEVMERCENAAKKDDSASLSEVLGGAVIRLVDDVETARGQIQGMYDDTRDWLQDLMVENRQFHTANRRLTDEYREKKRNILRELHLMRTALRIRRKQARQEKKRERELARQQPK